MTADELLVSPGLYLEITADNDSILLNAAEAKNLESALAMITRLTGADE